jgi:hypothetical protein
MGLDFDAVGESTLVHGTFEHFAYSEGSTTQPSTSTSGQASGQLVDILTVTGGTGGGRFHLPVRVRGDVVATGSVPVGYSGTPAGVTYKIVCKNVIESGSPFLPVPCTVSEELRWTASAAVDRVIELEWTFFHFGAQMTIDLQPILSAVTGSTGALQAGTVTGTAGALLSVHLGPAYATDFSDDPIPGVTVTSASGYDYTSAPEPDAAHLGAVAIAALAALASSRRAPSRLRLR